MRMYNTKTFTEIFDDYGTFKYHYLDCKYPKMISSDDTGNKISSLQTLYYLLYSKYGNSPIANLDENQFKYKLFGIVFQYGPNWEKELEIQNILRNLNVSDLIDEGSIHDLIENDTTESGTVSGTNGNTKTYNLSEGNTGTQATAHTGTVGVSGTNSETIDHDISVSNSGQFEDIKNQAANPTTDPVTNAYNPLGYINEQVAEKNTSSSSQTTTDDTSTSGSNSNTTTYNNTDTTTNNLSNTTTGTITDAGTNSSTTSNTGSNDTEATKTLTVGKLKGYERLLELLNSDITNEFLKKFKNLFQSVVNYRVYLYESED